jgi:hypothetical protein
MSQDTVTHAGRGTAVPPPPTGLVATVNADRSVDLSWKAVAGATGYGVNEFLTHPDDTVKEWVDGTRSRRGPLAGGHYRYGITARNAAGVSAVSTLVDVQVGPSGGAAQPPQEDGPQAPSLGSGAPGQAFDLSHWYLTMPIARPGDPRKPREVHQPELRTFRHQLFDVRGGAVEYVATVDGVPTSPNTESARCELREMKGPNGAEQAWWDFDSVNHTITCTLTCDPTGASPRKECIVGQIHARDSKPPIVLSVEMNSRPGTLAAFVRGTTPKRNEVFSGLEPDTVFTYRIQVTGGRCRLWVAKGDVTALPATPTKTFSKQDLGDPGECYFKAGAYNKSPIKGGSGQSVVRMFRLDLE